MKATKTLFRTSWPLWLAIVLLVAACSRDEDPRIEITDQVSDYSYELALRWNELLLDLERFTPGYRPPVSARTTGYVGLAAYEAVVHGMSRNNSLGNYFAGLNVPALDHGQPYHWPTSLVAAYAKSLELFFPTAPAEHLFRVFQLQNEYLQQYKQQLPHDVFTRSTNYGREVAEAVYAWSATDAAGHEAYRRNHNPNYQPPQGNGRWQPTYPDYTPALLPGWGAVRTFAATSADIVPTPLPYSEQPSSAIYQEALVVQQMVQRIKQGELEEEHWIAEFWSDDCPILTFTPAGRWIAVANQVVALQNVRLDLAVETYARLGMALCDAGIRCWHEKYRFNWERPIDYIRRVMGDNNWNTVMCPDGSGNYFTPPFPAYPSGHATFGAAAAKVLAELYGQSYNMTDRCHEGRTEFRGTPRNFNSFYAMAEENAYSRIPLGVHFQMDADTGLDLGYGIGQKVNALPWRR
jgi:membrane-associated phospholipid phosphatase